MKIIVSCSPTLDKPNVMIVICLSTFSNFFCAVFQSDPDKKSTIMGFIEEGVIIQYLQV